MMLNAKRQEAEKRLTILTEMGLDSKVLEAFEQGTIMVSYQNGLTFDGNSKDSVFELAELRRDNDTATLKQRMIDYVVSESGHPIPYHAIIEHASEGLVGALLCVYDDEKYWENARADLQNDKVLAHVFYPCGEYDEEISIGICNGGLIRSDGTRATYEETSDAKPLSYPNDLTPTTLLVVKRSLWNGDIFEESDDSWEAIGHYECTTPGTYTDKESTLLFTYRGEEIKNFHPKDAILPESLVRKGEIIWRDMRGGNGRGINVEFDTEIIVLDRYLNKSTSKQACWLALSASGNHQILSHAWVEKDTTQPAGEIWHVESFGFKNDSWVSYHKESSIFCDGAEEMKRFIAYPCEPKKVLPLDVAAWYEFGPNGSNSMLEATDIVDYVMCQKTQEGSSFKLTASGRESLAGIPLA